nr:zinc finger, CCHC-type [Tanacetum cinerariifolium]
MPVHIIVKDTRTMNMIIDQHVALDEALFPHASRLRIGKKYFRDLLHISPRLPNQTFNELPFEEEILAFLRYLGHSGEIKKLTDVNINKLHQPWRSFAAVINKCPRGKNTQQFGAMLPVELTNEDIRNSTAYKEYYAIASGAAPPKMKASVRKTQSNFDTIMPPPTAASTRLSTSEKGKQPAKSSKAKGLYVLSEVAMIESEQMKLAIKRSLQQTHISQASRSGIDEGTGIIPRVPNVPTDESDDEISWKSSDEDDDDEVDDKSNDDASLGMNVGGEEGHDAEDDDEELYRDVNINLKGINSIFESTPRVDVQASTTVASLTLTAPTLPPLTIPTISQVPQALTPPTTAPSTFLQDLPNFGSLFGFDHRLKALEANFFEFMPTNQFAGAVSFILEIVERYMDQQMNEAIEKNVNEQLEAEVLTRSSNSSNTSYAVAADLSEMELKKILIKKIESNKYIHRSDEQRNLYKALVDAYDCDKIILDTYGDTVTLKRRRDDANKDEKPSAGSDRGSKRRREGKEPESTSAPKEKATKTTGKSTQRSKSHQKTASEFAPAEEPVDLAKQANSRSSFNELMDTPVDILTFLMNRIKVDTLTFEFLAGPTYELMKGLCKSLVELEFFLEEVYKATTNQLDQNNPEGQQYLHNLLKPLPLIPNSQGRHVIPFDHFINNDLEYLHGGASNRKYTTFVTKTKAADYGHIKWIEDLFYEFAVNRESARDVYSKRRIITVTNFRLSNGIITSILIGSRCVEMMTSYTSSKKATSRGFTFKTLKICVESYQKKLNLTKPDTYRSDLKRKEAYIAYSNPKGFIYQNKDKQNRLMQIDELQKFNDGTLNDVPTALDDRLKAKDKEDHAKSGKVRWWEILRGRLQDATTDHMIYHMMSLSYKGYSNQTRANDKAMFVPPLYCQLFQCRTLKDRGEEHQSDTKVFIMKMEILLESTSNKLSKDSILQAGNPVKEILLKLNLPDHSDEVLKLKNFKKDALLKLFKLTNQERYEHVGPKVTSTQDGKVYKIPKRDYAWLMISRCSRSYGYIQVRETSSSLKSMITTPYSQDNVKKRKSASTRMKTFIESLKVQDSDKPKGNNVFGLSVFNMVDHNNSFKYNDNKGTKGSVDGSSNSLKGATIQVCKDRCWFKTYESLNDGSTLHMGNELTTLVHGRGYVDLRFSFGKIVTLFSVLHVPI